MLVWASIVDEMLKRLLLAFLSKGGTAESLVKPDRPLGSFGARAKMAYALGLIDVDEMYCCEWIGDVRNDFAHRVGIRLTDEAQRLRCSDLYDALVNNTDRLTIREAFAASCTTLAIIFFNRSRVQGRVNKYASNVPLQERSFGEERR